MSSLAFWLIAMILAFFLGGGMVGALVVCLLAILIGDGSTKTVFIVFGIVIVIMLVMGRI